MENNQITTAKNTQTDMMIARQSQEVQVAMLAAKRFPRDQIVAMDRIKAACQRMQVAEQAIYTYPRGGEKVSGPSIRLAEVIAQNWGNIESGVIELDNHDGQSEMMAYAWDLETNSRDSKIFTVKHIREKKTGNVKLSSDRDIYELTANFAARRKRACIMAVVPTDVVEMAVRECKATIAAGDTRPIDEITSELIKAFKGYKVTREQLEKYLGRSLAEATRDDLIDLRGIYKAIKDGQSKAEDYFPKPIIDNAKKAEIKTEAKTLADQLETEAQDGNE